MAHKTPHQKLSINVGKSDARLLREEAMRQRTTVNDLAKGCLEPLLRVLRPRSDDGEAEPAGK